MDEGTTSTRRSVWPPKVVAGEEPLMTWQVLHGEVDIHLWDEIKNGDTKEFSGTHHFFLNYVP